MKQFLRHISLLLALFMATASITAQTYIINDGGPYTIQDGGSKKNTKSFDISSPKPADKLTFNFSKASWGVGGVTVKATYSDGSSEEVIKRSTSDNPSYSFQNKIVKKLEFYADGSTAPTLKKEIKNIKLTQATYLQAPTLNGSALQENSIPFGEDVYGAEAYKDIKLNWSNISALSCSFTKNDNSQFAAQVIDGNAYTGAFGTATVRVTYKRTNVNTHYATLVISSGSLSHTINLSGKTGEFTVHAKKKIDLLMNSTYAPSDVFDVYYMKGDEKVIISDYTITPLNSQHADYVDGKIQTNYCTGNASFVLSRIAKESCKALNETISVTINQSEAICYLIENESTSANHQTGQNEEGTYSEVYTLNGIGDKLSFKCKLNRDPDFYHYLTPQYSATDNGNDFQDFPDSKISTDNGNEHVRSGLNIPSGTKRIRFKRTAATAGTANFSIYEIYVSRKKDLSAPTKLTLPQATIGKPVSASFDLNWSTCSDEIVLLSTNSIFILSKSSIDATSGSGTTTITVTYDANSGSQSGTIVIYDQSQKIEIPVSCEVKAKLATEIIYTGEATYPETLDGIPYPFYVKDENGNTVQGATVTLATSNEDILSFDANRIYPHCGGSVTLTATYAGDDTHESCSLSVALTVPYCQREIVWDTSYLNFATDENGNIDEKRVLDATINPESEITYQLHTVTPTPFAEIVEENGKHFVRVFGEGHGYIVATAKECSYEERMYEATYKIKEVRVSGAGACDPNSLLIWGDGDTEPFVYQFSTNSSEQTRIYNLTGLPADKMTFGAHAETSSLYNRLVISFSTDSEGDNWTGEHKQTVVSGSNYNWNYSCSVPAGAKRVRFQSEASLTIYFNGVTIPQQTYIRPSVESIEISDATVNVPFERTFSVDYSNVRLLQWEVSDNHNLGLKVSTDQEVNNDCGMHGTYTFTLTGMSPYPQENATETITFYTSAGDEVKIPVIITSKLGDTYIFKQDGNWSDLNNWRVNNTNTQPSQLPTPSNPVIIEKAATTGTNDASFEGIAYSITITEGGSLTILPQGGLTVHAGGFTGANENNLTLHNMQSGAGFIRISPYFTREVEGTMPKIKVLYQTKSTLDTGANKDATWQYIGAPGNNTTIYVDYNTWLYKLDEQNADWVLQPRTANVDLEPFEGYAITQYGQPTYQWTADITNENHTLPLTYSKDGRDGRHIFANSYTAPIDVKALHNAITYAEGQDSRFRIDQTVYIFNSGSWNAWDSIGQTASGNTPGQYYAIPILAAAADYLSDEQTVIPPMQGFYMRVRSKTPMNELQSNEHVGHIQLDYNRLVMSNSQIDNTPLRSPQRVEDTSDFQRARIHVTSTTSGADRLIIIQDTINTRKYNNGYDAPNQTTEGLANIYTNESFGKMEVSCSDNIDSLYIGFMAGEDSQYTLHFSAMCGDIYLKDLANDSIILMQECGQYHFTATPNSTNDLRFQILLDPEFDPSNGNGDILSDTEGTPSTQVWMYGNTIYIASAPSNSVAKLFNVSGHMIMTDPITYSPYTLDLSHLTPGVYMLQLNNQIYKFIRQ